MKQQQQPRSIWENVKVIIQGLANAMGYATDAISTAAKAVDTTAETVNEIAKTGHVMAKNNREIVEIESEGKKQFRLKELTTEYPDLYELPSAEDKEDIGLKDAVTA